MIQSVPYDVQFAETMTLYGLAGRELVFARRAVIRPSSYRALAGVEGGNFKRPARDTQASIDD